jgi:broad specificity phosphatase PhoE
MLIEAPLPPPNWPSWVRMSPKLWGFFARFWWWYFNHHEGQETRQDAEARADKAAQMLAALADQGQDVVVTAHGFFNHLDRPRATPPRLAAGGQRGLQILVDAPLRAALGRA